MTSRRYGSLLQERYPEAFQNEGKSAPEISCGEGWFEIVDTLCLLFADGNSKHPEANTYLLAATEKFGMLRVFVSGKRPEVQHWLGFAELHSTRTCEICGGKGRLLYEDGWQRTRCDMHTHVVRPIKDS